MQSNMLRASLAELIGTFMLVFIGAGAVSVLGKLPAQNVVLVAALAHGLILVVIMFTFGHISGAHVNPAVTLSVLIGGHMNIIRAIVYVIMQFLGGVLAAGALKVLSPDPTNLGNTVPGNISNVQLMVIEGILTFFLASTFYQTAIYGTAGRAAPLAIGFTLAACILFGGTLTGGSLNPARTLGPALVSYELQFVPYYFIGTFAGGAVAGLLHTFVFRPGKHIA